MLTLRIAPERVRCWALDGCGRRREEVPVAVVDGEARLAFGPGYRTVWYEITVSSL